MGFLAALGAVAHQVRHERSDLERHLLAFPATVPTGLPLDEFQLIAPRIQFHHASARWVAPPPSCGFSASDRPAIELLRSPDDRHAIAQVAG